MNYQELQKAKETFRLHSLEKEYKTLYKKREEFVKRFSPAKIMDMKLDDYVQGKQSKESFCYILEKEFSQLGNITGATAYKFGIYYDKKNRQYNFVRKFGSSYKEAFENIKSEILRLIEAGEAEDYEALLKSPISTMFKGKILSTYFPEKYLNIFGEEHLDYYLRNLDLDSKELMKLDPIYKRKALLDFKNSDPDMRKWSVNMFATFLWSHYPKSPIKDDERAIPVSEKEEEFPTIEDISYVELEIIGSNDSGKTSSTKIKLPVDYEKEAAKYKTYGDRGEYIVMQAELERIKNFTTSDKEANKLLIWVSRESDSFGYDIKSVNKDGSIRYIEVKATSSKCGDMDFYYTANELETAKKYGKDYYLYIVYNIKSKFPQIWIIQNPFIESEKLNLVPIKYKVHVKTKAKVNSIL